MDAIRLSKVNKAYGNNLVLNDVSFSAHEAEIVGYLGPNGSGKTTTIQSICGLTKYDSGSISVLGADVRSQYSQLYSKIAAIFDHNGLYERLSAIQNLEFFIAACGVRMDKRIIFDMLEKFDLSDVANKKVKTYSKGMKRKLALARVLLISPKILLLDEPFDGIDIESRELLVVAIKESCNKNGTCVLLTSHVMADIEELASRVIVIKTGKIIADASIAQFKIANKTLTESYMHIVKHDDLGRNHDQ
jgi:ABC-2 type transport system ATP-binding protein